VDPRTGQDAAEKRTNLWLLPGKKSLSSRVHCDTAKPTNFFEAWRLSKRYLEVHLHSQNKPVASLRMFHARVAGYAVWDERKASERSSRWYIQIPLYFRLNYSASPVIICQKGLDTWGSVTSTRWSGRFMNIATRMECTCAPLPMQQPLGL
jgi:hypothetical protein